MSITYKLNKDKNGVEIKFTEKPSEKVRARLKELGFRWSQFQGVWYAKQSEETIAFAKELANSEGEQIALLIPEAPEEVPEEAKVNVQTVKSEPKKEVKKAKPEPKKATKSTTKVVPQKVEEDEETPATTTKAKKDNIIVFPTKTRPVVNQAITEGFHTFDECADKLKTEAREVFKNSFSQYILDGLLGMCGVSQNFRNNVMRPDKTLLGAFDYFEKMAKDGYAFKHNQVAFMNDDLGLALSIDYFNSADDLNGIVGQAKKEVGI